MRPAEELIAAAARGICNADGQRHLRLENRTGQPCRLHQRAGWDAVEAILALDDEDEQELDDEGLRPEDHDHDARDDR